MVIETTSLTEMYTRFPHGLPTVAEAAEQPDLTLALIQRFIKALLDKPKIGPDRGWKPLFKSETLPESLRSTGKVIIAKKINSLPGGGPGGHVPAHRRGTDYFALEGLQLTYPDTRRWLLFQKYHKMYDTPYPSGLKPTSLALDELYYFWKLGFPLKFSELENDDPKRQRTVDEYIEKMQPFTFISPFGQRVTFPEEDNDFTQPGVIIKAGNQGSKIYLGEDVGVSANSFHTL